MISAKASESEKVSLIDMRKLGTACNTLAADGKYTVFNRGNLTIPIQMQLSRKRNTFSQFVASFWKSRFHFKYFEKKDDPHRFCIFEVTDSENVFR